METITAGPYEARQCPACQQWIYTAAGPFAEGDRTKTLADADHWEREHANPSDGPVFGFPFFSFNEKAVEAVRA